MPAMPNAPHFSAETAPVMLHDLPARAAAVWPAAVALTLGDQGLTYGELQAQVVAVAGQLLRHGLARGARVAVYLDKRFETVVAGFAATAAGGVLVPVNPVLKPGQVGHVLRDAGAQVLVTSAARLPALREELAACAELRLVLVCEDAAVADDADTAWPAAPQRVAWAQLLLARPAEATGFQPGDAPGGAGLGQVQPEQDSKPADAADAADAGPLAPPLPRGCESDVAAIFYTSGSTGLPKGVVLSHRNLVAGAQSVAGYLENRASDVLLAVLPLSFDAGFSQLTTGFLVGARVVLLNHLFAADVIKAMAREGVTGITAVPPLYMQLAALDWPAAATARLRYFACTGGRMPPDALQRLRERAPLALPFLMYGLTEAFRSTYLPPAEVDRRPGSMGRAIPNVEILVLREDGSECAVDEPGELVHRGPLVAQGYWRRPAETAERFRPLPAALSAARAGLAQPELAVYSGDTVRRDAQGFLYFVGRRDEMIKTSGYRVSPTEVEACVAGSGLVQEVLAVGRAHASLGQAIVVAALPSERASGDETADTAALLAHCRAELPAYMVPAQVVWVRAPFPRNPNGKLDRQRWKAEHEFL
jgi:acyl-CoA ligase (AMP-forming) (exosortase A-associated)